MSDKVTLSNDELIERCDKWILDLCKDRKNWRLSVPVQFNRDPDTLFTELIRRFKDALHPSESAGVKMLELTPEQLSVLNKATAKVFQRDKPKGAVWVKATPDNLPPNDTTVLVWSSYGYCMIALFLDNRWYSGDETFSVKHFVRKESITHWMPLPDNPNNESPTAAGDNPLLNIGDNEYYDLSKLSAEEKAKVINTVVEACGREIMKAFYSVGLKTHIECTLINDPTGEEFEFSFRKKATAAGDGKEEAVAFGKWLKTAQWQDGERKQAFMKNDFEKLYTIFKQSK